MTRYALNLPINLKKEAEEQAARQGISLNQFIMWSVSEKVTSLREALNDPKFPGIAYRRGESGWVTPVLNGTGIRVQTIASDLQSGLTPDQIAVEFDLPLSKIHEAQAFYHSHQAEIDASIIAEKAMEDAAG